MRLHQSPHHFVGEPADPFELIGEQKTRVYGNAHKILFGC
jgi:hypothetical protein